MEFEAFKHLIRRLAHEWFKRAQLEREDCISAYLKSSPYTAQQTDDNVAAYEKLMDIRMKLYDLSREIDNSPGYYQLCEETIESPDLFNSVVRDLHVVEEIHLIQLELMIIEQVSDWEAGNKSAGAEGANSDWTKPVTLIVTLPNGTMRTISFSQDHARRHWFAMCPVSSKIGELKLCAGCRVIGYLGKDEQKEDWPNHRELCKALKEARGKADHWKGNIKESNQLVSFLKQKLDRNLTQFELDIAEYPRICMICSQGDNQADLKPCKECYSVAFCASDKHEEEGKLKHGKYCNALETAAIDYRNEITLGHQVQNYVPKVAKKYKPLPQTGIEEFFKGEIETLVSKKLAGYVDSELRHITFMYSCPLTVLYGAQHAINDLEHRDTLTIHLLGARRAEFRHLGGWDILGAQLPNIKRLKLIFIGDEIEMQQFPGQFKYKGKELQKERAALETWFHFEPPSLYQDWVHTNRYSAPDLIVALDCGFKFYPTWRPALEAMKTKSPQCPLIFTEFTQGDQEDNLSLLKRVWGEEETQVIINVARNPYCSLRGFRCSDTSGNYDKFSVYYTNDFICIAKPR